ncbi:MAG: hypothetical protein KatS3mg101_1007 [Patescibacteria group bacterium]|nr:MAG: hypothetical protein KatS3mg101_1007 [Patescibacteria group bacterium]
MKLTKDFQNLNYLSQGEHSLEEVLRLAGLEEEKPENDDGFCSVCGSELEVGGRRKF